MTNLGDLEIFSRVISMGSMSAAGRALGLSPAVVSKRVKRLEDEGVIRGYTAILDQAHLGLTETVIIEVMLERHDDEVLERFGKAMAALPEVLEAYLTTGEYDYLIKVAVAGTAGYEQFLRRKLTQLVVNQRQELIYGARVTLFNLPFAVRRVVWSPISLTAGGFV